MDQDSDGIEEAFEGQLRVALTAAGRVAEIVARAREDAAGRAQAGSEQEAREWSARLDAERVDARAQLAAVHQRAWWESSDAVQIAAVAQVAGAWAREDPEVMRAREVMRTQLRERFGVDLDDAGGDPAAVREAIERAQVPQGGSDARSTRAEQVQADHFATAADATEAEAARGVPALASAQRRERTGRGLRSVGVSPEYVATTMLADISQAEPALQAITARASAWARTRGVPDRGERQGSRTGRAR